ncbi:MAG: SDR family oxidoreductase [Myxococcota bacterium]
MTRILVTGATGTIGSQIVEPLIQAEATVRAAVRSRSRASALEAQGAEIVEYDIEQGQGVEEAFAGVDRAFLLTPFVPDFSALTIRALEAARKAGVSHVVKLSAAGADPASPSWLPRNHGLGDVAVAESGLSYTILRPTFFQDNIITFSADSLRSEGVFYGASAGQSVAYVSSRDVGAVAAQALLHPHKHAEKTYDLTGGEGVTGLALAALLTETLGRPVSFRDISSDEYGASLRAAGTPEPFVEALLGLEYVKAQGWAAAVSPHVSEALGRAPETYAAFIARNRGRLLG